MFGMPEYVWKVYGVRFTTRAFISEINFEGMYTEQVHVFVCPFQLSFKSRRGTWCSVPDVEVKSG